jgi:hypothetical protein
MKSRTNHTSSRTNHKRSRTNNTSSRTNWYVGNIRLVSQGGNASLSLHHESFKITYLSNDWFWEGSGCLGFCLKGIKYSGVLGDSDALQRARLVLGISTKQRFSSFFGAFWRGRDVCVCLILCVCVCVCVFVILCVCVCEKVYVCLCVCDSVR